MLFYLPEWQTGSTDMEVLGHFKSMRLKVADVVKFCDFKGNYGKIKITFIAKNWGTVKFDVIKHSFEENTNTNILIQAVTDKQYLEKLFEILPFCKLQKLILFFSENSLRYTPPMERLNKIMIRSMEQCESLWMPKVEIYNSIFDITELVSEIKPVVLDLVAAQETGDSITLNKHSSIMVGPEGGWSSDERDLFDTRKLTRESLGNQVFPAWIAGFTYFTKFSNYL